MLEQVESQQAQQAESIIQISCGDFQGNPDGSWTATKQIDLVGSAGSQKLIPAGRRFARGEMYMFGLDLAAFLDKQCG
jgi:hypothetical protein